MTDTDLSAPGSTLVTEETFADLEIGDRILYTEVRGSSGFRWSTAVSGTITRTGVDPAGKYADEDDPWVEVGDEYEVFARDLREGGPGQLYKFPPEES